LTRADTLGDSLSKEVRERTGRNIGTAYRGAQTPAAQTKNRKDGARELMNRGEGGRKEKVGTVQHSKELLQKQLSGPLKS